MDEMKLLCDIGELNHLFRESISVENFMERTVEMVASNLRVDVCSIYIYDDDEDQLVLKASKGLRHQAIGTVTLKLGEGLTGKALKELRPVCVQQASKQSAYKYFPHIGEEAYEHFLAVPIRRGIQRIGVLVLQRQKGQPFTDNNIMACKAVASQLANIIENAKFLMTLHVPHEPKTQQKITEDLKFIRGKIASPGFAHAPARIVDKETTFAYLQQKHFSDRYTIEEFEQALQQTISQLEALQKQIEEKLSDAASLIFASHLMILKDHEFIGTMRRLIEEGDNPPDAILKIAGEYIGIFSTSKNGYVREKVQDVEDLTVRLISNLTLEVENLGGYENQILVARDLFPSDLLRVSSEEAAGIVLVSGGVTSHLSILARSLQIPMVIANKPDLMHLPDGTQVLLDGQTGNLYVEPAEEVIKQIADRNQKRAQVQEGRPAIRPETYTKDGTRIYLFANINLVSDLAIACEVNCEGVGLYRTEFPFIIRSDFPSEQEQYITYSKLMKKMHGRPVTFRTLDIGGDKILSYYHDAHEKNPSLGMRSIRFSLENKEIFGQQLRAILRAGLGSDLRIMFPMISSVEEFIEARDFVRQAMAELDQQGIEHHRTPKIGMMIELPSVIGMIDIFAQHADFFSIGTNDLIQFMLGVDRTNENVERFYVPHHPAVLRGLAHVVQIAQDHGKEVAVCGDMGGQVMYIPFLLGIGVRQLSVDPSFIPEAQQIISELEIDKAALLAKQVLQEQISVKIKERLTAAMPSRPDQWV